MDSLSMLLHTSVCLHKSTKRWKDSQASNWQVRIWVGLGVALEADLCVVDKGSHAGRVHFSKFNVSVQRCDWTEVDEWLNSGFVSFEQAM